MKYKYELHAHTKEVSHCGQVPAEEIVKMYSEKGYNGIVITDHYSPLTFMDKHYLCPQKDAEIYLSGYKKALAAAPKDFSVLLGMELRFYATGNDYLLYGIDEEFVKSSGNLMFSTPKRIHKIAQEKGYIFAQAHPYRSYIIRINSKNLDGAEVFNGKDSIENNNKALKWAEKKGIKIKLSGSDFHREVNLAKGGIETEEPIKNNADLLRILKIGKYSLIKNIK